MLYAIKTGGDWRELVPGKPILLADAAASYATMLGWTSQYRTSQGIKPIDDDPQPEGKMRVGASRLEDRNGKPVRVWDLDDEPQLEPVTPDAVTMRQAQLALLGAGVLDAAEAAIAAMPGGEGRAAQIEWKCATELRRDHPLVAGLGQGLGLDAKAIDSLFIQASQIA